MAKVLLAKRGIGEITEAQFTDFLSSFQLNDSYSLLLLLLSNESSKSISSLYYITQTKNETPYQL